VRWTALVLLLSVVLTLDADAQSPSDAAARYFAGRHAYEQRRYADVIRHLRPLLYPNILLPSEEQTIDAHRMLGVSYFMLDDREAARREFVSLLGYRADFVLDPSTDPRPAADFFESVKQELEASAKAARERQERDEARRRLEEDMARRKVVYVDRTRVVERVIDRRARWQLFLPFGVGQFANGQRRKAWFFLGAESALLGTTLVTSGMYLAGQGHWQRSDMTTIRALQWSSTAAFVSLIGVAAWGVIDALRHAPPRETVVERMLPASQAGEHASSARVNVTLLPGSLTLQGAF